MARHTETTEGRSVRLLRVGEQVRHALSDILMRGDVHDETLASHLVSITEVRMSPDLRHATAFVLPLGGVNTSEVVRALGRNRAELRRLVTDRIDLRHSPELGFQADTRFDAMDRTRELLRSPPVRRDLED